MSGTLSTLRKSAQSTTRSRGHAMRWGQPYGNATTQVFSQNGTCRKCGMTVTLHMRPSPNEVDIGGEAVALTCMADRLIFVQVKRKGSDWITMQQCLGTAENRRRAELAADSYRKIKGNIAVRVTFE